MEIRLRPQAVDARQEIDLKIGAAFTRFQTTLLQYRFNTQNEVRIYACVHA